MKPTPAIGFKALDKCGEVDATSLFCATVRENKLQVLVSHRHAKIQESLPQVLFPNDPIAIGVQTQKSFACAAARVQSPA
jgi:hypothetical protein